MVLSPAETIIKKLKRGYKLVERENGEFHKWLGLTAQDDISSIKYKKRGPIYYFDKRMNDFGFTFCYVNSFQFSLPESMAHPKDKNIRPAPRALYWSDSFQENTGSHSFNRINDFTHELGHWLVATKNQRKKLDFDLAFSDKFTIAEAEDIEILACFAQFVIQEQCGINPLWSMYDLNFFKSIDNLDYIKESMHIIKKSRRHREWFRDGWIFIDGQKL